MELIYKQAIALPLLSEGPPRSSGLHVTTVLRKIAIAIGIPNLTGDFPVAPSEVTVAENPGSDEYVGLCIIAMGLAFEDYVARCLGDDFEYHPGELELDGIVGSPDGWTLDEEHGLIIEEFKCTDKSSKWSPLEDERKWWLWLHQMMCYCHMAGSNHGRLWALHNRGNYGDERRSIQRDLLRFEESELEQTRQMVLNNR